MTDADQVWNRAAMDQGGSQPGRGDLALAAALTFHSLAMNGGLLHAHESLEVPARRAAADGYRYLALPEVAAVVEWVEARMAGLDLESESDVEFVEVEAYARYAAVVPDDATLTSAFESAFVAHPEDFARLQ